MTITLTPEIERALSVRAEQLGTKLESLALRDLRGLYVEDKAEDPPRTGADLLAFWEDEGVFMPREDLPDSPILARQLREQSQQAWGQS